MSEILRRFRDHRSALVLRREALTEDDLDSKSRHPRLRRAIRLIDWMQCVAGHDDHHLARAGSYDFTRLLDYTDAYREGARRFDMGEFPRFVLAPMATAALELAAAKVYVSIRGDAIRVAPHLYNDDADVDRSLAVLRECCRESR